MNAVGEWPFSSAYSQTRWTFTQRRWFKETENITQKHSVLNYEQNKQKQLVSGIKVSATLRDTDKTH